MATHTRGPSKRTRKPRVDVRSDPPASSAAAGKSSKGIALKTPGERPRAPWHPLPLSELLILAGGIGAGLAVLLGPGHNGPLLLVGIGAVAAGTIEVSLREHLSGFRSHAMLLAVLPVIALHSAVVLIVGVFAVPPRLLTVGFLAVDAALFVFLLRLLRLSFSQARVKRG